MRLFCRLARAASLFCCIVCIVCCFVSPALAGELSSRERSIVASVNASVKKAGVEYAAGRYDAAGEHVKSAMKKIDVAMKAGSIDLYQALDPAMKRISKAHAMLEFDGVSLPPFRRPPAPTAKTESEAKMQPGASPDPGPSGSAAAMISFTKQVAPILSARCGKCHIQGSKGQFSLATFASLMKGPPEGVVVFAGDTIGSRLIETIATGDMPRGNDKVTADELATLKGWIVQGAKFDGADANAPIVAGTAPVPTANAPRPKAVMATGKETVSFARDVAPIFVDNCSGCHIDAMQTRGGLRLDSFGQMLRGGDSGQIITPGKSAGSLLVKKIKGMDIEGERMPAGGRPPLSQKQIQLISTWIDEGATLDGASETQRITVMAQLAWAANATAAEMNQRRQELADKKLALVASGSTPVGSVTSEHFMVTGTSAKATLELVANAAEAKMKTVGGVVHGKPGDDFFHGKASIFVLPKRYDYSEFAKMVEQRNVPNAWTSHWKFDGVDAYVAVVASDQDDANVIADRLTVPISALAIATRGNDVPRWFAEGVGEAMNSQKIASDRDAKRQREVETREAVVACKDAKAFLNGKLTPVQTDRIAAAIVAKLMDRSNRKQFDACLRSLSQGEPFESAFATGFRLPVNTWVNNWLLWVKGS